MIREGKGWTLANCWLAALEETAKDFHGTNHKGFCERGFEHATQRWIRAMEEEFGITTPKASEIMKALENYIEACVKAGFFLDSSQFELKQVNPFRVEIQIIECPYRQNCERFLEEGSSIRELTCARVGCFRSAAEILSGTPCEYGLTAFRPDGHCEGFIEHR